MDNIQMGLFIAERRRQRGMTQRDLAACLNVTDKAVSKWERGQSSPDIALLQPLAALLEVTVDDLLSGDTAQEPARPLAPPPERRHWRQVAAVLFSLALLIGEIVCLICDLAMNAGITWSVFPVSSIIFAWLVLVPLIRCGRRGIAPALTMLTLLIGPFLLILAVNTVWQVFSVGIWLAAVGAAYLWGVYWVCQTLADRRRLAAAVVLALAAVAHLLIRAILAWTLDLPFLGAGDLVLLLQLAVSAGALFLLDRLRRQRGL